MKNAFVGGISETAIAGFRRRLEGEEKSAATVEKYMRDLRAFAAFCTGRMATKHLAATEAKGTDHLEKTPARLMGSTGTGLTKDTANQLTHDAAKQLTHDAPRQLTKDAAVEYKARLAEAGYAASSVNSMLAPVNRFFDFAGRPDLKVRALKVQRQAFRAEERELTKAEYGRLCRAARSSSNERLCLLMQTVCGTGIRVGELRFVTVEAAKRGEATVSCKAKTRSVFIVKELQKKLLRYASERGIRGGAIFVTRSGRPLNRSNIWREMKALCAAAEVNPRKVFPHNLRHLFARVFYGIEKDIAKLADILGHSSIDTTRIYIVTTGAEHRRRMERMHLIL